MHRLVDLRSSLDDDDVVSADGGLELVLEETEVLVLPEITDVGLGVGSHAAVSEGGGDLDGILTSVEEDDGEGTIDEGSGPDLSVAGLNVVIDGLVAVLITPDTVTLDTERILVDGNDLSVLEDVEGLIGGLGEIATDEKRSLHESPEGEVSDVLVVGHTTVTDLEHIGIVPATGTSASPKRLVLIEEVDEGTPAIGNITSGSPRVTSETSPLGGIVDTPLAHGEEHGSVGLLEGVGHGGVSDLGVAAVGVAVIVLEVVDTPGGVGVGIDLLVTEGTGSASAGLVAGIGVETELEALGVDVVGESLHARGEGLGVFNDDVSVVITVNLPAVIEVEVLVAELEESLLDHDISSILGELLGNVAAELVPGVETHLRLEAQAVVEGEGDSEEDSNNNALHS